MNEKIKYANCMKRKCEQCKYYKQCFKKKKGGKLNVSKSNKKV